MTYQGHGDPVGRRGRMGGVPTDITKKAEAFQKKMEPPYDKDDIISAYEMGAMDERNKQIKTKE